jgi:PDZ domain-containing secreted protein
MGYQDGDELVSVNGTAVNLNNIQQTLQLFVVNTKEGDKVEVAVRRKNPAGEPGIAMLSALAMKVEKTQSHILRLDNAASPEQIKLRETWLNKGCR